MENSEAIREKTENITPEMERRNASIFFLSYQLQFLAAPILYVGVVQAALCNKLGASAEIANLPASAYLVGCAAPILVAWRVRARHTAAVVAWLNVMCAVSLALVGLSLLLPIPDSFRILFVIAQSLICGVAGSVLIVFMYQSLGHGTRAEVRAKALKWTFTVGPIIAVGSSLGTQFILDGGVAALTYPYDFALIYSLSAPCVAVLGVLSYGFQLLPVRELPRQPLLKYIVTSVRSFRLVRALVLLWIAYLLYLCAFNVMSNFSLYTKEAIHRDPKEVSGWIMALRFGSKAVTGLAFGVLALRWGERAPILAAILLIAIASIWACVVPGYFYLMCFGLMGAAELGNAYFANFTAALSDAAVVERNLSLVQLAIPLSSLAPPIYGLLAHSFGFRASFVLALAISLLALWTTLSRTVLIKPVS